jgi:chromosome segregation ATPase
MSMDPKNNSAENTFDLNKLPDSFLPKNQEFYIDCLGELQGKLKYMEIRLSMMNIIFKNRGIPDEELEAKKIAELLSRNRDLNEEDFNINYDEKNNTELVRMLEESFEEKLKTFRSKKQFIGHIRHIREDLQTKLGKIFDQLNSTEDEYMIIDRTICTLQEGIIQNNQEAKSLNEKLKGSKKEKDELEKEQLASNEELETVKNRIGKLSEEVNDLREKTGEKRMQVTKKMREYEALQSTYISEQFNYYESKEKSDYIDELYDRIVKDLESVKKIRGFVKRKQIGGSHSEAKTAKRHRPHKKS